MKQVERIFYLFVIIVLFGLLMFTNYKLNDYRKNFSREIPDDLKIQSQTQLNSFYGTDDTDEKQLILFNSYSQDFFIFVSYSKDCGSCDLFLKKMQDYFSPKSLAAGGAAPFIKKEIDKEIRLILLTTDNSKEAGLTGNFKRFKISRDDSFQFGLETPTIFAVDGKGEILFRQVGYSDGVFEKTLETINKKKYKKSRVIR